MEQSPTPLELKVWGEFACFTRPEMKVERVSYPVPTPSAMRGVLEAVFWKPEVRWRVLSIGVLKPIRYFSILRNEVNTRQSEDRGRKVVAGGRAYDASDDRAQRYTLALRDVAYLVRAQLEPTGRSEEPIAKWRDQFRRRVKDGRCFSQPFLGCREFTAYFAPASSDDRPIDVTDTLGSMLLDLDYDASGRGTPRFFDAQLHHGWLHVPAGA